MAHGRKRRGYVLFFVSGLICCNTLMKQGEKIDNLPAGAYNKQYLRFGPSATQKGKTYEKTTDFCSSAA